MSDKYPGGFVTAGAPAGFSVAFDGNGDSVTAPQGSAFQFPADFTIEAWVYANSSAGGSSYSGVFDTRSGNVASSNSAGISFKPDGYLNMYVGGNNVASSVLLGASRWVHVALARSGSSVTMYQNGVSVATTTTSANLSDGYCTIGGFVADGYWNGYISNVRVVKGTALYTTTFTPPTQLFPVTNTQLLTCQSPTIIDNSGNSVVLTVNGNAAASNFTPFAGYTGFNPALGAAAGGVWTLDEAAYYQQNRLWPIYDPYFNQTTLMLHGNGTNAAQNNTFLDSSTNNFTITRNGNTTQGSFTPFSQTGWSNFFDGTDDRLTTPSNAALTLGTGDYTYECWVYHTDLSNQQTYFARGSTGNYNGVYFYKANTTNLIGVYYTSQIVTSSTAVVANQWLHLAVCRASGTTRLFINGVQVGSGSDTTNLTESIVQVGADADGTNGVKGYISNARVLKGVALYTANFTPSTAPLTAVTGTSLLTCQDNRFVDDSANNFALTVSGTPSVQAFSPFVPAYITPTTYSNYFNGSSSYLSVASSALDVPSSTNFTIEGWVYLNAHTNNQPCIFNNYTSGGGLALFAGHNSFDGNLFNLLIAGSIYSGGTIVYGQWTHFAVVRNGTGSGNVSLYINGISVLSTISTNAAITYTGQVSIGTAGDATSAAAINGCISNFRWNTTTAVYTAAFTPPTAPLTAISGTQLLTCQNSTFIDNSTNNLTLTAAGTVRPVTSPTPFPAKVDTTTLNSAYSTSLIGGSGYFDGSGDYLSVASGSSLNLGTNDYTMDLWWYPTAFNSDGEIFHGTNGTFSFYNAGGGGVVYAYIGTGTGPWDILSGGVIGTAKLNQWNHIAITRSGSAFRSFLNGVPGATATSSSSITSNNTFVGARAGGAGVIASCYISNCRILSGTALYTSAFAPPIAPPTPIAGTSELLSFTNGAIFDNTAKNVLETVGTAQISTTQSKWGGSSMYFDGSTGYLKPYYPASTNGTNYSFGTGDFTLEFWMYPTSTPAAGMLMDGRGSGASGDMWLLNFNSGVANWYVGGNLITSSAISANTWTHLAVCKAGGSTRMFLNGVQTGSTYADSKNYTVGNGWPTIGASYNAVDFFAGYLDDIRITKGYARYKTNFTPPTSQLQDQ